ncbi:MAG: MFS transporter [Candidatus Izemoplasmatales bacterium]|nr:MFS transporter [Candidatus Izemoplasmatales bacterium]MDD4354692.1 MFS transporter [Candidatus Izemoplasmatales bacterium]MDD4988761.1 MFS transporter [Candidatus Izemoplasmatales bacterium]
METEQAIKKGFIDSPIFKTSINSAEVKPKEMILGYFIGPFLALISNAVFGSYINRYYSDVIGWTNKSIFGFFSILLPLLSVVLVVVGNLFCGRLIDKTRTSQGKARPYMLLSSLLLPAGLLAIVLVPGSNPAIQMLWICISYNIYYSLFYPIFYASHSAMVGLSTRDSKKRGLLSTFSNASAVAAVGIMASMIVPMFLQSKLFVIESVGGVNTINAAASLSNWRIFIIALSVVTFIGVLVEYYNTRERITEEGVKLNIEDKKIPMIQQIKAVVSNKYWWIIIVYFLLFQFGGLIKNGSMTYFCDYVLEGPITGGQAMGLLGLVGGIPTAVGMVIAWPIANKLTKQKSILFGMIISVLGGLLSFIDTTNFYWVCAGIILKGIGSIPAMYVTLALLSDVLDHLEAKNGFRSDGFTMSVYGSIMVGLFGVSMAFINFMLLTSDYDPSVGVGAAVKTSFVIGFLVVELICYAIIAGLMIFLNVEKHLKKDQEKILANQKAEVLASGGEWIDPAERLRLEQEEAEREESEKKEKRNNTKK